MILFVNNNRGILFLSEVTIITGKIVEYLRRASKVTIRLRYDGRIG